MAFPGSVSFPEIHRGAFPKIFGITLRADHHRQTFVVAKLLEDRRRKTSVAVNATEDHHRRSPLEDHHRKSFVEAISTKDRHHHHYRYQYNLFLLFLPVILEDHLCKSSMALILIEDYLCKIFVAVNPPEDRPNPKEVLSMALLLVPKGLATSHSIQKVWFEIPLGRVAVVGRHPPSICVAFSPTLLIQVSYQYLPK
jgi:hypothetical protein